MKGRRVEHNNSVQQLVDRARGGDKEAFDELVGLLRDRLSVSVRSWAKFQVGPRVDAEEVVQETFVQAFSSIGSFEWRDDDSFFRWLCGIAKRVLVRLFQDSQRGKADGAVDGSPSSGPSQSKIQRRHERFDRLEAALKELSPEYRKVLLLSGVEGLTAPQIAERMNRSPNAVRHLIVRALRELREKFGDTASFNLPDRQFRLGGGQDD